MPPLKRPEASENSDALAGLQARYDGRLPRRARLSALAGGDNILYSWAEQARGDRLLAQCAGARLALARRRRHLPAAQAGGDPWLCRLTAALHAARNGAVEVLGQTRCAAASSAATLETLGRTGITPAGADTTGQEF